MAHIHRITNFTSTYVMKQGSPQREVFTIHPLMTRKIRSTVRYLHIFAMKIAISRMWSRKALEKELSSNNGSKPAEIPRLLNIA